MLFRIFIALLFLIGILYLLAPGLKSIADFPGTPGAVKSDEPGDTYQNPNIAGYYGDKRRNFVTNFYKNIYETIKIGSLTLPSIRLNHPPEEAFKYIRDQQRSTYLEEYLYPLRGSIFVNGYEPFDENGKKFNHGSYPLDFKDKIYPTKVTIRYYYVPMHIRIGIYILYWLFGIALFHLLKKGLKND